MNKGFLNSPRGFKKSDKRESGDTIKTMEERIQKSSGLGTKIVDGSMKPVLHNPPNKSLKSILKGNEGPSKSEVPGREGVEKRDNGVPISQPLSLGDSMGNVTRDYTNAASTHIVKSSNVTLPKAAFDEINARFVNSLIGFSVGKKLAFPVVENYVKSAWDRFGLERVMMHCGYFMFQFDSKDGMEKVLERGPWRIQLVPIMLKTWQPNILNLKDKVSCVPLWIKLHKVPIVAFSKVGIELISAKVGKLIRLDEHTKFICLNSWGRSEYARVLMEVSVEFPLVESVDLDIPLEDGKGYITVQIWIEYEGQPPRCGSCKIFDHLDSVCPMKRTAGPELKISKCNDKKDSQAIHNIGKTAKGKQASTKRYIKGYRMNIPKIKQVYRAVIKPHSANGVTSNTEQISDTTKQPSTSHSPLNGMNFINDDINLEELSEFRKKAEKESIIEFIGEPTKDGCMSRGNLEETMKSFSSMDVINADSDTDVEDVHIPTGGSSYPSSSFGGGQNLERFDDYDDIEDQLEEYPCLYNEFCDQYDFKVKGRGRN
ncbi:zinc knuckle CX2CX4HX4C containing protein [Tanacetum coccineum]